MDKNKYIVNSNTHETFSIKWDDYPVPEFADVQGKWPLSFHGTSMMEEVTINFYASNSNSFPYGKKNEWWGNILPTWSFKDKNGNVITSITLTGIERKSEEEKGIFDFQGQVWFVDCTPTKRNEKIYLWATLSMNGLIDDNGNNVHASSLVFDIIETSIGRLPLNSIYFTTDGIESLSGNYHWTDNVIPFVGTAHSLYYDTLEEEKISTNGGIIFDFPNNEEALIPFKGKNITHKDSIEKELEDGRIKQEWLFLKTPISAYENEPQVEISGYMSSSGNYDITKEKYYWAKDTDIQNSEIKYKAPAFKLYNDDKNYHFYTGGYFIGNITMPDWSASAGYEVSGSAYIEGNENKVYVPMNAAWIFSPIEGYVYQIRNNPSYKLTETTKDDITFIPKNEFGTDAEAKLKAMKERWEEISANVMNVDKSTNSMLDEIKDINSVFKCGFFAKNNPVPYKVWDTHGIYNVAIDLLYNAWMIDTELALLYKFDAKGNFKEKINLNEQFENLVKENDDSFAKSIFFKNNNLDTKNNSLQPSWICFNPSPKQRIYIAYFDSHLITIHDRHGKMLSYICTEQQGYKALDKNKWHSERLPSGNHTEMDNIIKPSIIAGGKNNMVWITYTSTSVGLDGNLNEINFPSQTKISVYKENEENSLDFMSSFIIKGNENNISERAREITDLSTYNGSAFVLIGKDEPRREQKNKKYRGERKQSKFSKFYIESNKMMEDVLIDYNDGYTYADHLTITKDGNAWFHAKKIIDGSTKNVIIYFDIENKIKIEFENLYKINQEINATCDEDSQDIDGLSIDSDNYLWIIDNRAEVIDKDLTTRRTTILKFDAGEMVKVALVNNNLITYNEEDKPDSEKAEKYVYERFLANHPYKEVDGSEKYNRYPNGIKYTHTISPYTEWENTYKVKNEDIDIPFIIANGDWTGIKLETMLDQNRADYAIADSGTMHILNYKYFRLRKFKESWDTINAMKSCILVQKFKDSSESFWDEYAKSMVGGVDNTSYPIGRRLYERISNITPNLHDIEESTINGLYSMAQSQDVPMNTYDLHYPEALQRIADIFSCRHEKIWGERCHCNRNFVETQRNLENKTYFCKECGHWHKSNLGKKFNIGELDFSNEKPPKAYVVKNPMDSKSEFKIIIPSIKSVKDAKFLLNKIKENNWRIDELDKFFRLPDKFVESILKLDTDNERLLAIHTQFYVTDLWYNYCFWEYRDIECGVQNIGIINWDDQYTTFPEKLDGIEDFYCEPDVTKHIENGGPNGYANLIFDYLLHNGLMYNKDGYKD